MKPSENIRPVNLSRQSTREDENMDDDISISNKNQIVNTARNDRTTLSTQSSLQSNDIDDALTTATCEASLAAATLVDGALHVRAFPDNLTVEPASIPRLTTVGSIAEFPDSTTTDLTKSSRSTHPISRHEELRCVLAIIRQ
jgi:hypothetical protein